MKPILTLLLAFLCPVILLAQKKNFTIAEATNGLSTNLALQNLKQVSWQPGTSNLFHVVKTNNGDAWVRLQFPSGLADTVLTLKEINTDLYRKDSLKSFPNLQWISANEVYFSWKNCFFLGMKADRNWNFMPWIQISMEAENIHLDPATKNIIYTVNNNLFVTSKDNFTYNITDLQDPNIICGKAVHRNEFGIDDGIFINPTCTKIAYYKMDQTMVADYPIVDWSVMPAKVATIKYPMAGATSHEVSIPIFDLKTQKTTVLQIDGPADQYLTCVTWKPDGTSIYVGVLNRAQNHLILNEYNATTGAFVKTLFEEKNDKYVEPQHELTFIPGKPNEFIWWSQRDGFMHLYLYNTDGKMMRQLTKGNWVVNELVSVTNDQVFFTSTKKSPLEKQLSVVQLKNSQIRDLTTAPGTHTVSMNANGAYFYDLFTNDTVPKIAYVGNVILGRSDTLLKAKNTLLDFDRPVVKSVNLKATDGTSLFAKMILPTHFDSTKTYPIIVYLYNGPHVQLIKNSFPASGNLWYEYMAQKGYIVFTMDGRGSSNRGLQFEQAVFRQLGTVEMDDQLQGVAYLKNLVYVDTNRMGIHGWSFGGFMTTSFMLRHPGVFKVGVAGGPVLDWSMYEVMYGERYMDTPKENPEGYAANKLTDKVSQLKGKLLLIHGTSDDVVVMQHSINAIKKSVEEGVQIDYFVYPNHLHNVRGKDRVHLMQKITDYFDTYLK
jgi:dipeptidyl-peptidase-4